MEKKGKQTERGIQLKILGNLNYLCTLRKKPKKPKRKGLGKG